MLNSASAILANLKSLPPCWQTQDHDDIGLGFEFLQQTRIWLYKMLHIFFFNWKWPHTVRTTIYSTLDRKYFPFDNKPYLVKPRWLATVAKENKQSSVAIWHTARRYLAHASEKSVRNSSHASWQQIDSCSRHWQRSLNLSSTNGVLNLDTCFVLEKPHTEVIHIEPIVRKSKP